MKIFSLSYFQILANVLEPVLHFQFLAKHALLDHHVINLVRQNSYTCVLILVFLLLLLVDYIYTALADTIGLIIFSLNRAKK